MDTTFERRGNVLISHLSGRLDAFGAGELGGQIRNALHDDDRALIIDLAGCPYLSSAGIRIFALYRNEMQKRGGGFALASVPEYPMKVLDTAGFTSVLSIFPSVETALSGLLHFTTDSRLPAGGNGPEAAAGYAVSFSREQGVDGSASLHIIGDLTNVLYARIEPQDVRQRRFSEVDYSLGLGALGASAADAMPLFGEMITLHGSMVWLPTDGHNVPDFLTPRDPDQGDVYVYTGFAATLRGPFSEYLTLVSRDKPVSLTELYRIIFSHAKKRREGFSGIVAIALYGIIDGVASTGVIRSPIKSHAPPDGSSIMSPENLPLWIATDSRYSYTGDTLVAFGIGIDLTHDLSAFNPSDVNALSYINPANRGDKEMYLHNHGVVFRNVPYDDSQDLNTWIRKIVTEAEFLDMRHLLDTTRIRRAKAGIAYISRIEREQ